MSVSVELIACHDDEPAWSAIDRFCGPGMADALDEDDPTCPVPLYDTAPDGWRDRFVAAIRRIVTWNETAAADGLGLSVPNWRWHLFVGADAVTLSYRRTGPARPGDFRDDAVLAVASSLGMVLYWPDVNAWVDLRCDPAPRTFG